MNTIRHCRLIADLQSMLHNPTDQQFLLEIAQLEWKKWSIIQAGEMTLFTLYLHTFRCQCLHSSASAEGSSCIGLYLAIWVGDPAGVLSSFSDVWQVED